MRSSATPDSRERCFTDGRACVLRVRKNPAQHYAGRFAGKEAVGKALGFGVARAFAWRDVEIVGRPKQGVRLHGRLAAWSERVGAGEIDLSMTHSRELAQAVGDRRRAADARAALHGGGDASRRGGETTSGERTS